jgi:mono/diheme cytochrome c family protein
MHCASCHATPGPDGQPDPARPFAGGKPMQPFGAGLVSLGTGALIASNITPDRETGIGAWTAADLARGIKLLVRPDGSVIRGPMQFYAAGWSAIDDRDLAAIAAYLKRLPPVRHRVPEATFEPRGASRQP